MNSITRTTLIISLILLCSVFVSAQIDAETRSGKPKDEPLPQPLLESMAKSRIEQDKKDHEALIKKGNEAVELSKEIQKSFDKNKKLTSQDISKLKNLEKLLKKVRSELGGEGGDEDEPLDDQKSQANLIRKLQSNTERLFEEIKNTSRYTISAVAINSSNAILSILKFLRLGN
jgi:membrane-associated HD superfamily phosphohydrolase